MPYAGIAWRPAHRGPAARYYGWPVERLRRRVLAIVGQPRVARFTVGRTVNLSARRTKLRAHVMIPLAATPIREEILAVEGSTIRGVRDHPKNCNIATHGGGKFTPGLQHLYVALWLRPPSTFPLPAVGIIAAAVGALSLAAALFIHARKATPA